MTDCDLIYEYLKDHQWHNVVDMCLSLKPNAVNWAVRSRISNLNKSFQKIEPPEEEIESKIDTNGQSKYKLIKLGQLDLL